MIPNTKHFRAVTTNNMINSFASDGTVDISTAFDRRRHDSSGGNLLTPPGCCSGR